MLRSPRPLGPLTSAGATSVLLLALSHAVPRPAVAQAPGATAMDPQVASLVEQVSPESLREYLTRLVSFETRHTLSTLTPREGWGITAARDYLLETLSATSPRLVASLDCYQVAAGERIPQEVEICNVLALLPGRSQRRIYVSGHYDSVALQEDGTFDWNRFDNPAPGANDDGSGTALTLELARVLSGSGIQFDATLVFIAFAGEEQGLLGSSLHAAAMRDAGVVIDAVFNNDIVGNVEGGGGALDRGSVRVFAEGLDDSPSHALLRHVRRAAEVYVPSHAVRALSRRDRFGRGGDQTSFTRLGYPAVRFTEARENFSRQHVSADTLAGVDFDYLAQNARVNLAAVATLALAPSAPIVVEEQLLMLGRGPSGYDAHLRWQRSPGAAGYRVVWRDTWSKEWEHERLVGDVDELLLEGLSIDDHVFGVAAVGAAGHESVVTSYRAGS